MASKETKIEPVSQRVSGITLDSLVERGLLSEMKKEMPTLVSGHFYFGFADSDKVVSFNHDRVEGKVILDYVDVTSDNPETLQKIVQMIQRLVK